MRIGLQECFLCQVVAQRLIAQSEMKQEPAHRRLVFAHQLVEGLPVVQYRHLRHERDVTERLHCLFFVVFSAKHAVVKVTFLLFLAGIVGNDHVAAANEQYQHTDGQAQFANDHPEQEAQSGT